LIGIIVRTIDACAVHATSHEVGNESVVGGSLGWHGDEDPSRTVGPIWAEQGQAVRRQDLLTFLEADRRFGPASVFVPGEDVKVVDHMFERRDDVLFGTTKGGQAELRQRLLNLAQLEVAESQVVDQVRGAEPMGRKDPLEGVSSIDVALAHLLMEYLQLFGEFVNRRGV
jgi:hypothetical protein